MPIKVPDVAAGSPLSAKGYNKVAEEVERLGRISVEPPLELVNQANGVSLRIVPEKACGDLSGEYPCPTVVGLQDVPVCTTTPTDNKVLTYDADGVSPIETFFGNAVSGGSLADGTHYYYVITSLNSQGESAADVVLDQADFTAATPNLSFQMYWLPVAGATGYKIYRSTTTHVYGATSLLKTLLPDLPMVSGYNTFTDVGTITLTTGSPPHYGTPPDQVYATLITGGTLIPATTYYYVVTVIDLDGIESPQSGEVFGTIPGFGVTQKIQLNWFPKPPSFIGYTYKIYRTQVSGDYTSNPAFLASVGTNTYTDDGTVALTSGSPPIAASAGNWCARLPGMTVGVVGGPTFSGGASPETDNVTALYVDVTTGLYYEAVTTRSDGTHGWVMKNLLASYDQQGIVSNDATVDQNLGRGLKIVDSIGFRKGGVTTPAVIIGSEILSGLISDTAAVFRHDGASYGDMLAHRFIAVLTDANYGYWIYTGSGLEQGLTGTLGPGAATKGGIVTSLGSGTFGTVTSVSGGTTGLTFTGTTSLTLGGTLTAANGGTGVTTIPAGGLVVGNGTSAVTSIVGSVAGQLLSWSGSAWQAVTSISGVNIDMGAF